MNAFFSSGLPNADFWTAYRQLWQNSLNRSPFQAPDYTHYLAQKFKAELLVFQCLKEEQLIGAAFFRKSKGNFIFLSEIKADHNCFVIDNRCSTTELYVFFQHFVAGIKKKRWPFILTNHANWISYVPILDEVGRQSQLFWDNNAYSVCPTLKETSGEILFKRFNGSKELRYRVSRLKNQQEAVFEWFQQDEDLSAWVSAFCQLHIKRWEGTPTPSRYESEEQRQFLLECLKAWIDDELLVRFSVKVADGTRIGFVICLLHEATLIHHTTAYDDNYRKYSPGKALLHFIGEWMAERDLKNLDFGQGNEKYKYEFANTEPQLNRIYVSSPLHLSFIVKAKVAQSIRNNEPLRKFYREKIKPRMPISK